MSQWGRIFEVSGAQLQPLVEGAAFAPISGDQVVVNILPLQLSADFGDAELAALRDQHIGRPYAEWPAR